VARKTSPDTALPCQGSPLLAILGGADHCFDWIDQMSMVASTDQKAARRLEQFRRLLTHVHERILPDLGFVLWDGSTVPADLGSGALALVIADEGAVAAMMRRPNIDTFLNLWVTSRFDLRNGTFFDLASRRPKARSRTLMKTFEKRLALTTLARFLFVPAGGPWPLEAVRKNKVRTDGSDAANRTNIHYHYDLSNRFYEFFLDPEMATHAPISRTGITILRPRRPTNST